MAFRSISTLTPDQIAILKTDILSNYATVLDNGKTIAINIAETNFQAIADYYNQDATPVVSLWIPNLNPKDLNKGLVMTEFIALTALKQQGWFAMTTGNEVDATNNLVRTNFGTLFGGNSQTTANLSAMAQKNATRFEALFANATSPASAAKVSTLFSYLVTFQDIDSANR